jgi:hypothetical protein
VRRCQVAGTVIAIAVWAGLAQTFNFQPLALVEAT